LHIFSKKCRALLRIEHFGPKVLIIFLGSIAWNVLFPIHAANYFSATPYILLAGFINLGWAFLFSSLLSKDFFVLLKNRREVYRGMLVMVWAVIFIWARITSIADNPPTAVPGIQALKKYEGAQFYSNIWPLFISYYTKEWTVGNMSALDAVNRNFRDSKWFLQKDKWNFAKYSKPDFYFYATSMNVSPFAGEAYKQILDQHFQILEQGKGWYIYDMRDKPGFDVKSSTTEK